MFLLPVVFCLNSGLYMRWYRGWKGFKEILKIFHPAPPSGTEKCVPQGCLIHFFQGRAHF